MLKSEKQFPKKETIFYIFEFFLLHNLVTLVHKCFPKIYDKKESKKIQKNENCPSFHVWRGYKKNILNNRISSVL